MKIELGAEKIHDAKDKQGKGSKDTKNDEDDSGKQDEADEKRSKKQEKRDQNQKKKRGSPKAASEHNELDSEEDSQTKPKKGRKN